MTKLAIVTATLNRQRSGDCIGSWYKKAAGPFNLYEVIQDGQNRDWQMLPAARSGWYTLHTEHILGPVAAFALGLQKALDDGADLVACLHDDLEILEAGWDETVVRLFKACPRAGLVGFGGGKGLGSDDIYQSPYNPMQLARQRFLSNMQDAEAHGERCEVAVPVACLDGFSQIGKREFWLGQVHPHTPMTEAGMAVRERAISMLHPAATLGQPAENLLQVFANLGVVHHAYDSGLGAFAKALGWQVWLSPIRCHHYGGRTAVGDARYTEWALQHGYADTTGYPEGDPQPTVHTGDAAFWQQSHRIIYDLFKDILPIRT